MILLSLAVVFGQTLPAVIAPGATPDAVAPPQALLPSQPSDRPGQTASINGVDIYYEVYGQGDPVILLDGGLSNAEHFVSQIPALAENYRVVVMDSRGHGRSSFDAVPLSYAVMAADVLGLMDHLGLDRASIVGWSDGGIIGLELAIHHPERLTKVVAYGANFDLTSNRQDTSPAEDAYFDAYVARAAEEYRRLSPAPERWDEFRANISTMWSTQPNYTAEQLTSITTPILVLDGAKEEAIDPSHTNLMASRIPGAKLAIMPDTGHFAMFEQPDEFNRIVDEFLAS